jgi:hypothetical protein
MIYSLAGFAAGLHGSGFAFDSHTVTAWGCGFDFAH